MVTMGFGWAGRVLRVDLSARRSWVEPTERYAERFIGGIGIGYKVLWDEVGPEVGAFDPENRLVFAPGPLTGTLAPGSGRMELVSVSPRSYPRETVTRSGMGGFWGAELKYAGYDALVIEGKSDGWVNLWICDDRVAFLDAEGYLGEDTYETQLRLRKELGDRVRILCIGPAGERLSRLAVILSETSFASGRSGFGAVMGSKNLKAIAVRGTKPLRVFDPERLIEASKRVRSLSAKHTSRERTTLILNLKDRQGFINKYRKRNTGCFGCPLLCFAHTEVPGAGQSAAHCISYFYHPQATKFYGASLEMDQAVSDGYVLANRMGLDTFEFWQMVNLLRELHGSGSLPGGSEIPFDRIGSREFIRKLLKAIALREGIGDLLAEGSRRAADRIPGSMDLCGKYFPAYGSAAHGPLRNNRGVALLWALDSRAPIIDQHTYIRLGVSFPNEPHPYTLTAEKAKAISRKFYGSESAIDPLSFEYKPEAVIQTQNRSAVIDILVLCDWIYPIFHSFAAEDRLGDTSLESRLLAAVTGHELQEEELNRVGERVWNLARAIMVKEGRTRGQDTVHEVFFKDHEGEKAVSVLDFESAKTRYYRLRGWDEKTGWPAFQKLADLELLEVAQELGEKGLLPGMAAGTGGGGSE